jgi:hypothetical protein
MGLKMKRAKEAARLARRAKEVWERGRPSLVEAIKQRDFVIQSYFLEYGECEATRNIYVNLLFAVSRSFANPPNYDGFHIRISEICDEMVALGQKGVAEKVAMHFYTIWSMAFSADEVMPNIIALARSGALMCRASMISAGALGAGAYGANRALRKRNHS